MRREARSDAPVGARGTAGAAATILLLAVGPLLGACTGGADPTPTGAPTTGVTVSPSATVTSSPTRPEGEARVAVVVAPDPPLVAATAEVGARAYAVRLADDPPLRVVTADDASFLPDLVDHLSVEGYELVCALGAGAAEAVRERAPRHPGTRFCAAPALPDGMPGNVLPIDLRVEEIGYLAGLVAGTLAPDAPSGLVHARTTWSPARYEQGMNEGIAAADGDGPVASVGPVQGVEDATETAAALFEGGVGTVLTAAGVADRGVLTAAVEAFESRAAAENASPSPSPTGAPTPDVDLPPIALLGSPELRPLQDGAPLDDRVVAITAIHLEEALELAVRRLVEGWSTAPASIGVRERGIVVFLGTSPLMDRVGDVLERALADLASGDLTVPVPTP